MAYANCSQEDELWVIFPNPPPLPSDGEIAARTNPRLRITTKYTCTEANIMEIDSLDKKRFDALIHQSRSPAAAYISDEVSWWSTPDESVVGVVLQDLIDNDFVGVALGRDEVGQYRAIDVSESFVISTDAKEWLHRAMRWHTRDGDRTFPQGDTGEPIDFFSQIVPDDKLHPYFVVLRDSESHLPARDMIKLMSPHFRDIDGNFVEQFQTTGFDSRLWELYLHAYLVEEGFFFERDYHAPDFIVHKHDNRIGIEAVTVGRKSDNPPRLFKPHDLTEKYVDVREEHKNAMPIRFGSPLFSKLQKKYWELLT